MFVRLFIIASIAQLFQEISSAESEDLYRIINGHKISLQDVPYQISLQSKINGGHVCGGSIISKDFVLTAAHCVKSVRPNDFILKAEDSRIIIGTADLDNPLAVHDVSLTIIHENWNPNTFENDITLLKVEKSFEFNDQVAPAKLPQSNEQQKDDTEAIVSGFGYTSSKDKQTSQFLMAANVVLVGYKECADFNPNDVVNEANNICIKGVDGKQGWCNGDSGGPISIDGTVIGIVSWSQNYGCYADGQIQVGTRVSSYIDWISNNIK